MGYTHYFNSVELTPTIVEEVGKIIAASNVSIKGWDGTGEPVITESLISFNGDEALSEEYETFSIENGKEAFNFCKTAYRPYDEVVVACLVSFLRHGTGEIGSDGNLEDWADGIELYKKATGVEEIEESVFQRVF